MTEFEILGLNEIDVGEISQLILDVKTAKGEWSNDVDLERVKQVFLRNFEDTEDSILLAKEAGKLIGLIVIHSDEQNSIEMNPWFLGGHPVVDQESSNAQLDSVMIQRVKEYAESIHAAKVNVHYMKEYPPRAEMYEELGMTLFEEVTHLRAVLSDLEVESVSPTEVATVPLCDTQVESLYNCWYASFQSGQDRSFFTRSQEQNRAHFEEMFDTDDYDTRASIALMNNEQVVGFALVKQTHGENNGHIWELGVHPDFKRRGYAKFMLAVVRDRLLQEDIETISLNYDTSNEPAMKLYRNYNFKEEWTQIGYTWIIET
ncbi:MAG: GNAT family N-acetyltransferase [Candidatus Thorarchaeota archaeon]|jgi:ribosomal protein S18 acetylase RimI-like enzyme